MYVVGHATEPVYAECGDVDTCLVTLTFPCGAITTIEVSRGASYGYDQRMEVRYFKLISYVICLVLYPNLTTISMRDLSECYILARMQICCISGYLVSLDVK